MTVKDHVANVGDSLKVGEALRLKDFRALKASCGAMDVIISDLVTVIRTSTEEETVRSKLECGTVPVLRGICKVLKISHSNKKKSELIDALVGYAVTGLGGSARAQATPQPEALTTEVEADLKRLVSFESLTSWSKHNLIKSMEYDNIFSYLVEMRAASADDRKKNSFKSLKGYGYFSSGWVVNVWMASPDEQLPNYVYVRGHVYQSYPSRTASPYIVFVCMSREGEIYKGKCGCAAGLGESCSHVAALLHFVLDAIEKKVDEIPESRTCTDKLMSWHKPPSHMTLSAVEITETVFEKPSYGKKSRAISGRSHLNFEPRSPQDVPLNEERLTIMMNKLATSSPSSGIFHFWDHPSLKPRKETHEADRMVRNLLIPQIPKRCDIQESLDREVIAGLCLDFMDNCSVDASTVEYLERATRKQAKSDLWRKARIGRLTSSVFHDVLVRQKTTSPHSLVSRIMGYSSLPVTSAMKWGIDHEPVAVAEYLSSINANRDPEMAITHQSCGLSLHLDYSFLGASSDGLLHDPMSPDPNGIIEIKCPVAVQSQSVSGMAPSEIAEKYPSNFFLQFVDGELCLRKSHRYYTQVQGELSVMNRNWADFVVWTKASRDNVFVQRIQRDPAFWDELFPKLQLFYLQEIAPEIIGRHIYLETKSAKPPGSVQASSTVVTESPVQPQTAEGSVLESTPPSSTVFQSTPSSAIFQSIPPPSTAFQSTPHPGPVSPFALSSSVRSNLPSGATSSSSESTSTIVPSTPRPGLISLSSRVLQCCNLACTFKELKPKPCRGCSHMFHHICSTDDMGNYCSHCYCEVP